MINSHKVTKHACTSSWSPLAHSIHHTYHQVTVMNKQQKNKGYKQLNIHISCKCDTNRAGHFTLDAHASRPVACHFILPNVCVLHTHMIIHITCESSCSTNAHHDYVTTLPWGCSWDHYMLPPGIILWMRPANGSDVKLYRRLPLARRVDNMIPVPQLVLSMLSYSNSWADSHELQLFKLLKKRMTL